METIMNNDDLAAYIRRVTLLVDDMTDTSFLGSFRWLSQEIYYGKAPLRTNSVQFIIAKILNSKGQIIDIKRRGYFNLYVIGDFRKSFTPILSVAEALADFYIEMNVLPNIIPLSKLILRKNKELLYKVKNGVLLYERR